MRGSSRRSTQTASSSTRRTFLQSSLATGALLAAAPAIRGAERTKKYKTALIGSGWWGTNILREALASEQCQLVALCDVDQAQIDKCEKEIGGLTSDKPKRYQDFRELLDKEKPEIVLIATPDHWHPLITIAAVHAGAHVYVEKPVGHTIGEGRAMVKAARETQKVVQVGMHRRVSPHNMAGMEFLRSGKVGKIGAVRAFVHYPGGPETPTANSEVPEGLDWNMWCGPAPLRPFNTAIHAKGFRNFLDYSNGTLGDWGIHWMDQILWWTEEKAPKKISSVGGRFIRGAAINDGKSQTTDAPDTQFSQWEFDSFVASWEQRDFAGNNAEHSNIGVYYYGTNGTFHMGWQDGWTFFPANNPEKGKIHMDPQLHKPDDQNIKELFADFLDSVQKGKKSVCDIEIGHRSTNMSLLGMLSLKLGRSIQWDGDKEQVPGDAEANALLKREYRGDWKYPV